MKISLVDSFSEYCTTSSNISCMFGGMSLSSQKRNGEHLGNVNIIYVLTRRSNWYKNIFNWA